MARKQRLSPACQGAQPVAWRGLLFLARLEQRPANVKSTPFLVAGQGVGAIALKAKRYCLIGTLDRLIVKQ
jgi:hypothetical protein